MISAAVPFYVRLKHLNYNEKLLNVVRVYELSSFHRNVFIAFFRFRWCCGKRTSIRYLICSFVCRSSPQTYFLLLKNTLKDTLKENLEYICIPSWPSGCRKFACLHTLTSGFRLAGFNLVNYYYLGMRIDEVWFKFRRKSSSRAGKPYEKCKYSLKQSHDTVLCWDHMGSSVSRK